jgi:hypothetical protein
VWASGSQEGQAKGDDSFRLTTQEAYQVLGLGEGSSSEAVIKAKNRMLDLYKNDQQKRVKVGHPWLLFLVCCVRFHCARSSWN